MRLTGSYLRLLARCMWVSLLDWSGRLHRAEEELRNAGALVILTFHRVLDDVSQCQSNSLPGIVIRERTFEQLVQYITSQYEPVSLGDSTPGARSEKLRVAITFDDGWHDNYTSALPIVRANHLPVTVFLCPGLMEKQSPFWPEQAIALLRAISPFTNRNSLAKAIEHLKQHSPQRRQQYFATLHAEAENLKVSIELSATDRTLTWNEVHEMDRAGICFGSHTNTHQILTVIPEHDAHMEVRRSKEILERQLEKPCTAFAYPNGNLTRVIRQIVEDAGFDYAVTTQCGASTASSDTLAMPRVNVCEDNVVGLRGRFWPEMFRYTVFYKAWKVMNADLPAASVNARHQRSISATGLSSTHLS
jgi:peptidoglycan/xylan/chitin deacetylase (PgdA/CDA1 family)